MSIGTPEVRYAQSGDVHIAYKVFGEGPIDVVIIPGAWSHLEDTFDLFRPLYERVSSFARVAVFDKRGTGLSDRNVGIAPLEERMDDTRAVMDACGMERASIIGQSEGGPMSFLLAATFPERVRSLVAFGSSPVWRADPNIPGSEKAAAFADDILENIDGLLSNAEGWHYFVGRENDQPETREIVARLLRNCVSPRDARQVMEMMRRIDVRETLPLVSCPTLVVGAKHDAIGPPEACRWIAEQIPGARYAEIDGNHVPVEPALFEPYLDLIEEFLTGTAPALRVERALATVLFTDIVSSTEAAARLGDRAWKAVLERHDDAAKALIHRHGGRMVKSTGDGILATFDGPGRAARCALELTGTGSSMDVELRAGIHTGEIELRDDGDVSGIAVHLASRVEEAAAPGEVLVSRTVTDLTFGSELRFESRGVHQLKGVPGEWELFAVEA